MEDLLILFISFLIIMGIINLYKTKNSKVKYVNSDLYNSEYNSEYLVRHAEGIIDNPKHDHIAGANAICFMRANLMALVKQVRHERCNGGKVCNVKEGKGDAQERIKDRGERKMDREERKRRRRENKIKNRGGDEDVAEGGEDEDVAEGGEDEDVAEGGDDENRQHHTSHINQSKRTSLKDIKEEEI